MKYDRKTENKSFIDMWHHLQRYNIENNIFMLGTRDSMLLEFSMDKWNSFPRATDSDYKVIESFRYRLIDEIRENIWFYFREIVFVPDKENPGKFRHFNLTPQTMMMIYLYINNSSYITTEINEDILMTQYFLWAYNRHFKNNDMIITNSVSNTNDIIKDIDCSILNSKTPVPLGTNEMISDSFRRCIFINEKTFTDSFDLFTYVNKEYKKFISINYWMDKNKVIFTLDNGSINLYNRVIELNKEYKLYLLGNEDNSELDKAGVLLYDKDKLKDIYLI